MDVEAWQAFFVASGVWIRPFGRTVYVMPPLVITGCGAQPVDRGRCVGLWLLPWRMGAFPPWRMHYADLWSVCGAVDRVGAVGSPAVGRSRVFFLNGRSSRGVEYGMVALLASCVGASATIGMAV